MTHYLRTFEHLAPTEQAPLSRGRRRRIWIALPFLAFLAVISLAWPRRETRPAPETAERATAPRIALATAEPPRPAADVPQVRVIERQGPKLIEKLLAEKFGTALPKAPPPRAAEPPAVVALPRPAPPPIADRPQLAEKPLDTPAIADTPAPVEVAASKPPALVARLTKKPEPAPAPSRPATKPEPRSAKREAASKPESTRSESKGRKQETARPEPPTPARMEEQPVVVARAEQVRAEPVEEKPIAVTERVVAVAVPAQAAVAVHAEPQPVEEERVAVAAHVPSTASSHASGLSHDAVRGLLDRYAAAWRGHDVDTLRAIGQVTNDGQANALRQYFASVGDLDVEVRVLDIRSEGDRTTVRFTRLDRFRDPTGRQVAKESPAIEKNVVSTPNGLRFAPAS